MSEDFDYQEEFTIGADGWATCSKCGCQYKGADEAKTRTIAHNHYIRRHTNAHGQSIMMDNPLRSKRTNYGAWV